MKSYHLSLYCAIAVLNQNIKILNSYAKSPKSHNFFSWASQNGWTQVQLRRMGQDSYLEHRISLKELSLGHYTPLSMGYSLSHRKIMRSMQNVPSTWWLCAVTFPFHQPSNSCAALQPAVASRESQPDISFSHRLPPQPTVNEQLSTRAYCAGMC